MGRLPLLREALRGLVEERAEEQAMVTLIRQEIATAAIAGTWTPWRRFASPRERVGAVRCGHGHTSLERPCRRESSWVSYSPDGKLRKVRCDVHTPREDSLSAVLDAATDMLARR